MTAINQLAAVSSLSLSDLMVVFSTSNGASSAAARTNENPASARRVMPACDG